MLRHLGICNEKFKWDLANYVNHQFQWALALQCFGFKSEKLSEEPEIKKFLFLSFPSDPCIPKTAMRICHNFPFETILPLRHCTVRHHLAVLKKRFGRLHLSGEQRRELGRHRQIMVQIKAEQEMGFPLAWSFGGFVRMIQAQKAQIRVISFFSSKQENLMELTVVQNTVNMAPASCNKKYWGT